MREATRNIQKLFGVAVVCRAKSPIGFDVIVQDYGAFQLFGCLRPPQAIYFKWFLACCLLVSGINKAPSRVVIPRSAASASEPLRKADGWLHKVGGKWDECRKPTLLTWAHCGKTVCSDKMIMFSIWTDAKAICSLIRILYPFKSEKPMP